MFENATKIAFTDEARYYNFGDDGIVAGNHQSQTHPSQSNSSSSGKDRSGLQLMQERMLSNEYLCFLGINNTRYERLLRASGWPTLDEVQLLTPSGQFVMYNSTQDEMTTMTK